MRQINLTNKNNKNIELRIANENNAINMIGVVLNPSNQPLECFAKKDLIDIRDYTKNKNGYLAILDCLDLIKKDKINKNKLYYWYFNNATDIPKLNTYQNISSLDSTQNFIIMLNDFYMRWKEQMYDSFFVNLSNLNVKINFQYYYKLLNFYNRYKYEFYNDNNLTDKLFSDFKLKYIKSLKVTPDKIENYNPAKNKNLIKLLVIPEKNKKI